MGAALVTGAAGNLGIQHAIALQRLGHHVILTDIDLDTLSARATGVDDVDAKRLSLRAMDVSDEQSVEELAETVAHEYGALEVLVNNAQGAHSEEMLPFEEFPLEAWSTVQDVNLTGTFLCCKHFGSAMAAAGRGSIINVASVYGVYSPDFRIYEGTEFTTPAVYAASKAGVIGLTRYLAVYWADAGVRVNAVSPGGVSVDQPEAFIKSYVARTPAGRMARPEEIRGVIAWLASDESSYVTGQNILVDGGLSAW